MIYRLLLSCLLGLASLAIFQSGRAAEPTGTSASVLQAGGPALSTNFAHPNSPAEFAAGPVNGLYLLDNRPVVAESTQSRASQVTIANPGDTIESIARREGLSAPELAVLNHTAPTTRLFPGQPIRLLQSVQRPAAYFRFGSVRMVVLPSVLTQGQAGWLQAEASRPLALKAFWDGSPLGILPLSVKQKSEDATTAGDALTVWGGYVPVPASVAPGVHQLSLYYDGRGGATLTRTYPIIVQEGDFYDQHIVLPPDKSALLDAELLQAEFDYLSEVWSRTATPVQWRQPLRLPLPAEAVTTSPYGVRRNYNGGQYYAYHTGHDYAPPGGSLVVAPADGIVALAEPLQVRGISVVLDHGAGLFTAYWHLRETLVAPGDMVQAGQPLGLVGTTGRSTGDHLHWELRIYGIPVDPLPFLEKPLLALAAFEKQNPAGDGE